MRHPVQITLNASALARQLPGEYEYATLSDGICHYRVDGPVCGKPLMLIHGATVPGWQFDLIVPLLNQAGLRTIQFDLFGHGYSDRPDSAHDLALFTRQALDLIEFLNIGEELHVLGHSLGTAITADLLLSRPEQFASVIMSAPLVDFLAVNRAVRLLKMPWVGELLIDSYVVPMLVRRRTRRYRGIDDGRFVQMFRNQLQLDGFGRSLLSLVRSGSLGDQRNSYRSIAGLSKPIMLLRGSDDRVVTDAQMDELLALLPQATVESIDRASHASVLTHPQAVAEQVIQFLMPAGVGPTRQARELPN